MTSIDPCIKYIGYTGCYTEPKQADPFGGLGGVPHDESKVGTGIQAIGVSKDGKLCYLAGSGATGGRVKIQKVTGDKVEDVDYDSLGLSNPSYLAVSKCDKDGKHYLCTASEVDKGANMHSFVIDPKKDPTSLVHLSTIPIETSYPCHFNMISDPLGGEVRDKVLTIVCSYGRDKDNAGVSTFLMNSRDSGDSDCVSKLQELVYSGNGSMSNLDRQLAAHAHSTATCPGVPNEIFMADLGKDSILQYQLVESRSVVNLKETGKLGVPLGSGPRSLSFRPAKNDSFSERGVIGIVSLEIKASLLLVRRRVHDGCLEILQSPVSILPEAWPKDENIAKFNKGRWASDVVWSSCGKFVFAAARLHNSISIFELKRNTNHDGEAEIFLELLDRVSTGGQTPRCLCMSPEGDFLLIVHQHSHDITCFQVDNTTGKLTLTDKLEHPLAACVKLIPA
ncbi:MAG: hypothetical protein SGBAC_007015 [Bacillariaceae sp.]